MKCLWCFNFKELYLIEKFCKELRGVLIIKLCMVFKKSILYVIWEYGIINVSVLYSFVCILI